MGSGKSTVGRHLARRLGWSFFDLDDEIEAAEKTTIAHIFDTRGEAEFRRIETAVIGQHVRSIERGRPAVLALGGGAFSQPGNRLLLADAHTYQRRQAHAQALASPHSQWAKQQCTVCHLAERSNQLLPNIDKVCVSCHQNVRYPVPPASAPVRLVAQGKLHAKGARRPE